MKVQLPIQYKIGAVFIVPLSIIFLTSWLSFKTTNQLIETAGKVAHSQEMLKGLEFLLSRSRDVESGTLGYLITGNDAYLRPFESMNQNFDKEMKAMRKHVGDNEDQLHRLDGLEEPLLNYLSIADELVTRYQKKGTEPLLQFNRTNELKNLMDEIRNMIMEMEKAETEILAKRNLQASKDAKHTTQIIFIGSAMAPLIVILAGFILRREMLERDRAEKALRDNEQQLQAVMDNSTTVIYVKDTEGRYMMVNHRYETIFKLPRSKVVGKTDEEIFPEETAREFQTNDKKVLEAKKPLEFEETAPHADGLHSYISIKFPLLSTEGEPYAICGISTDITERQQAREALQKAHDNLDLRVRERTTELAKINDELRSEIAERSRTQEALSESEERFRSIFEDTRVGMTTVGLDYRYIKVNKAMADMLGYTEEELQGKNITDITPKEDHARNTMFTDKIIKGELMDYKLEKRYIKKTGEIVWGSLTATLIHDNEGKPICMVGIVEDITERKLLEEQFRQSQKMEAVGQLAGGVAHDFNNMLNVILGYSSLVLQNKLLDASLAPKIESIQSAGKKAAQVTRQLLAFSRRQVLQPRILNINTYVQESASMVGQLIGENIKVQTTLEPDLWSIKVDPGYLDQIILNLVVNARDAMPNGGSLSIQTANLVMHAKDKQTAGPFVMLKIQDAGCGIPPEIQSKIFEPFFTTKEVGRGTGLGLSTVYGIIKQSGGFIEFESEVGKGTTFKIYFPRSEETAQPTEKRQAIKENAAEQGTLLIVENEDPLRELVKEILSTRGYTILEARSGAEAIEICKAQNNKIDLVFTDVIMPEMNGMELADELHKSIPNLKIIFTSGYAQDENFHQNMEKAHLDFIAKPYEPSFLVQKVYEVLHAVPHTEGNAPKTEAA